MIYAGWLLRELSGLGGGLRCWTVLVVYMKHCVKVYLFFKMAIWINIRSICMNNKFTEQTHCNLHLKRSTFWNENITMWKTHSPQNVSSSLNYLKNQDFSVAATAFKWAANLCRWFGRVYCCVLKDKHQVFTSANNERRHQRGPSPLLYSWCFLLKLERA